MDETLKRRALGCYIVNSKEVSIQEYVKTLKEDWNIRASVDPSVYVCASSNAKEEDIQSTGRGDFEREFLPRVSLPIDTCLEIGCGLGRMSQWISGVCKKLYAADISGELLNIAKKRLSIDKYLNIGFIELDGYTLKEIKDNSIDVAFEYICFQHIGSAEVIESYIREVARVLKIGGYFVMHGRDVSGNDTGFHPGNTWHGCRIGPTLVKESIEGTSLIIDNLEGINTDRFWAILKKKVK